MYTAISLLSPFVALSHSSPSSPWSTPSQPPPFRPPSGLLAAAVADVLLLSLLPSHKTGTNCLVHASASPRGGGHDGEWTDGGQALLGKSTHRDKAL